MRSAGGDHGRISKIMGNGISTSGGATVINGGLGISPGAVVTEIPAMTVNGPREVADSASANAQLSLTAAYNDAATRSGAATVSAELGGTALTSGVYKSASGAFAITGVLQLDAMGDSNAVWIFQMESTLVTAANSSVVLLNGAQSANVFWQVGSSATLGTGSSLKGAILALTSITLNTGAQVSGRTLARNGAVTLDGNSIAIPASKLTVADFPNPQTAGVAGSVTVTASDLFGNTVTDYTGTIHFTSSDAQAFLPADYTFLAGDAGVKTFAGGVTLKTEGMQTIMASDLSSAISGAQSDIVVNVPDISVTLACPPETAASGDLITYAGTVKNSGSAILNNVVVVNNRVEPDVAVLTVPSLSPGAFSNFTASFTVPANVNSLSGKVTATGQDLSATIIVTNTATATCPILTTP